MTRYALDTNTISYALFDRGRVLNTMRGKGFGTLLVPSHCVYEAHYGMHKAMWGDRKRHAMLALLATCTTLEFNDHAAQIAGTVRAQLEKAGNPIGEVNCLIAATALAHEATLVTRNTREFSRVPGLLIEDWF
jgi:tRNA(fMet)-specific endonuclease VapC